MRDVGFRNLVLHNAFKTSKICDVQSTTITYKTLFGRNLQNLLGFVKECRK